MSINHNPSIQEPLNISVNLTSDTYAFEVPRSMLNIQVTSEGLILDFINESDGSVITTYSSTYGEMYDKMLERSSRRLMSMMNHPCTTIKTTVEESDTDEHL